MRLLFLVAVLAAISSAQDVTQSGFVDATGVGYPQTAPNDSGRAVGELFARYDLSVKLGGGFRIVGGLDAQIDTHQETELAFSLRDRETRRPNFALRRLSVTYGHGKFTLEVGKQFIDWGKSDFVRPTNRFAPQDYVDLVTTETLAVTAARLTYGSSTDSFDVVYSPWLTPARAPLLNQRWAALSGPALDVSATEVAPSIPGGGQWGARWNHTGETEYSFSYYRGYDYLPLFAITPEATPTPSILVQRFYPELQMFGADLAVPTRSVTLKAEAAYFQSSDVRSDEYLIYVLELERQIGEWNLIVGYAGEVVTASRDTVDFSPLRGFARAAVGRASYTIDANRSLSIEGAVRQNGKGLWLRPEYTQAFGQHWRLTAGMAIIRGDVSDFIGQYRRNQFVTLRIRYSF